MDMPVNFTAKVTLPSTTLAKLRPAGHIRQATVFVRAITRDDAMGFLFDQGIRCSAGNLDRAKGEHYDEIRAVELLGDCKPGAIIVTTLDRRIDDALAAVTFEGVTVVGYWRQNDRVSVQRRVELV